MVKFAQAERVGDRSATLQQASALRLARRQHAAKQNQNGDKESHFKSHFKSHLGHVPTNAAAAKRAFKAHFGRRLPFGKIAEKHRRCLGATGGQLACRFTLR